MRVLRILFAGFSFFAASGLFTLALRADNSGQLQAFGLGAIVTAANGLLLWKAR